MLRTSIAPGPSIFQRANSSALRTSSTRTRAPGEKLAYTSSAVVIIASPGSFRRSSQRGIVLDELARDAGPVVAAVHERLSVAHELARALGRRAQARDRARHRLRIVGDQ